MSPYVGRFAPSPTGPLHFGSLVAALASYLEARSHQGKWLVRMEDLDSAREMPGAADSILKTLDTFGFEWDEAVLYQSQRHEYYASALAQLANTGLAYPCACSRKEISDSATQGIDGLIYPGTCRHGAPCGKEAKALRIKVDDTDIQFEDAIQGNISQNMAKQIGDFVLKRADGFYAYQLAVVVDDAAQHITHIVRGADLLDSTSRQIYLQKRLGFPTPNYAHVPIAANAQGEKLSKQTLAHDINEKTPVDALFLALKFLGQYPPHQLQQTNLKHLWEWAIFHWDLVKIPQQRLMISSD
ncbi:tRNA glutamyl-Q synthetase [Methylovorus sp. MM2]|uniref:tRNA glutamyl-Q(34) synthetase GluQRS n=1 Tax=Methylovorus sp. MM2 TaxID=1848038 RepID=UPI0007DF85C9|nr:tRNA glutamyl-Q(34) synthetase GluQRS [Methylovorus sp. MM2]OAM52738.1 tRNA glutamyl-Q synthetase [Methylovorus sp. MM2]